MALKVTLDDTIWRRIMSGLKNANRSRVKVGVIGSAASQTVDGVTLAEIAMAHQYGSPKNNIPARPFIDAGINASKDKISTLSEKLSNKIATGKMEIRTALETLGEAGASAVRNYVKSGSNIRPPLKPGTIKAKGSSRPLVDTGRMINAVSYEVVEK